MSEKHLTQGSSYPELPDDGKLRLYSMRFCPYDHRAHLMLVAKDIPHHTININLGSKPDWFLERSPTGKVPTLEIPNVKSKPLTESMIIADYLDEKYPETLLRAKDPLQHAIDRVFLETFSAFVGTFYKIAFAPVHSEIPEDVIDESLKALEILEKELNTRGTKFLAGDKPGYIDYMVWPWGERVRVLSVLTENRLKIEDDRFGKFIAWEEAMKLDRAVISHFVAPEFHAQFIKKFKRNYSEPDYDILL